MRSAPVLALLLLGLLAACAAPFQSRVTRFNALAPAQGEAFVVQPRDPEQAGGLEFAQYAQEVTRRLVAEGYRAARSPTEAALVVTLGYGVDEGRERVATRPGAALGYGYGFSSFGYGGFGHRFGHRGYGRFGGRYGLGYGGFYDPFWDSYAYGFGAPEVYSFTEFGSFVEVEMRRTATAETVFEGRAEASSRDDDLPRLVPNLVQALFTGFPGRSGETVRVAIDDKGRATQSRARAL